MVSATEPNSTGRHQIFYPCLQQPSHSAYMAPFLSATFSIQSSQGTLSSTVTSCLDVSARTTTFWYQWCCCDSGIWSCFPKWICSCQSSVVVRRLVAILRCGLAELWWRWWSGCAGLLLKLALPSVNTQFSTQGSHLWTWRHCTAKEATGFAGRLRADKFPRFSRGANLVFLRFLPCCFDRFSVFHWAVE